MVELHQTAKFDTANACRAKAKSIRMLAKTLIQPWTKERALALAEAWETRARHLERVIARKLSGRQTAR